MTTTTPNASRRSPSRRWFWYLIVVAAIISSLGLVTLFAGYTTRVPEGLQPISNFDIHRYLGKWYEIARLDHSFERGLQNVTAEYTEATDGAIQVLNRGYNPAKHRWEDAEGTARFIGEPHVGSLKVSFFGPFYGGYHILAIDRDYKYAVLTGPSRAYLWILAREDHLPEEVLQGLLHQAQVWGFKTEKVIRVSHSPTESQPQP